jgi:hypothetical protein
MNANFAFNTAILLQTEMEFQYIYHSDRKQNIGFQFACLTRTSVK